VIVDVHSHVVAEAMSTRNGTESWRADLREVAGRKRLFQHGRELSSVIREFVEPARMAEEARADGVDHLVLSPWVRLLPFELPMDEARDVCRIQNLAMAEIVATDPERFSALGSLPMQDPELAAQELPGLRSDGLAGVELSAVMAGRFLGDDAFEPFWAAAEKTSALLFVHPTTRGLAMPVFDEHYLWNTVANPIETAVTGAHLVLERHPGLRIVLAHGGGALPALRGRLRHAYEAVPAAGTRLQNSPEVSLRRLYYDTITHDRSLLMRLIEDFGAGQVLLGSDRPFDMGSPDPVGDVRALGLPEADERAVLGATAASLLGPRVVAKP
jgi:aminocarboxymuconate-semialdehyde decarboxylase